MADQRAASIESCQVEAKARDDGRQGGGERCTRLCGCDLDT